MVRAVTLDLWQEGIMAVREEGSAAVVASRISFPAQVVINIVATVITVAATLVGTASGIRSDVRDIATRMEMRESMYRAQLEGLEEQLAEQKRQIQLLQLNFEQFRVDLYRETGKGAGSRR